ncbi:MAG: patatin-like phospholipase family protein [Chitinophagaceae bacterium]|nr:patatin-like phospholipase family protein [Chitinophagaceae bacterium]
MIVSDVLDDRGNQYAHLVQKGGGVLGVALVGYTYVLESMGIRFCKQAGTSAGAINTALMTVIGEKQDIKSPGVLQAICDLDFFSLVDGHPVARWIIKQFITDEGFVNKTRRLITRLLVTIAFLIAADIILVGLQHAYDWLSFWAGLSFLLTGVVILALVSTCIYTATLLKRLKNAGFGINPGDFFYDWIKKQFKSNGINNITDLKNKAATSIPGLHLRVPNPENLNDLDGSVAFITSELSSRNKIQFPAMCDLFRKKEDIDTLQPAGFVRASMSIPLFFESYIINDIPCDDPEIKKAWLERFNEPDPPSCARFVDGGILSNFPINLFYNPKVNIPRLPVFGIDLDDSTPGDKGKYAESWSLAGYFGRMFSTIQNNSDKEFLLKNKVYGKGVGKIKVAQYNWLNFFLPPQKKIELFILGAQAATAFLIEFDWEAYKRERAGMQSTLTAKNTP